jgi:hypothetical protein
MDDRVDAWRRDVEEAISENDPVHTRIILDRVFQEIEDAVSFTDYDEQ